MEQRAPQSPRRRRGGIADGVGRRNPSRSGSRKSAAPPSISAPTSPTSSSIPRARNPRCPISPAAPAMTSCSAATCRRSTRVFDPAHPDFDAAANPVSTVYGGRMVDPDRITAYTWDARPHPAFPADASTWGDSANWGFGHWLTGRLASAPLAPTIAAILRDHGFADFDVTRVQGTIAGYVVDRIMSAREALQPLELSQFIDAFESNGAIHFASRAVLWRGRRLHHERLRRGQARRRLDRDDAPAGNRAAGRRQAFLLRGRVRLPAGDRRGAPHRDRPASASPRPSCPSSWRRRKQP